MPKQEQAMNVVVDVTPAQPHAGTTLASCLNPLMQLSAVRSGPWHGCRALWAMPFTLKW